MRQKDFYRIPIYIRIRLVGKIRYIFSSYITSQYLISHIHVFLPQCKPTLPSSSIQFDKYASNP
ncbi:hypothetical protein Hanom_Chr02g00104891 [Helianthus anomalus]